MRGTNHDDFTKKASAKNKPRSDALPKADYRMTAIRESSREATTEPSVEFGDSPQEESVDISAAPASDTTDVNQGEEDRMYSDVSETGTEISSRASSVHTSTGSDMSSSNQSLLPQPFNIDRKSSLVQGLPSAHLHLDEADLLHPFMDPFTPTCGL